MTKIGLSEAGTRVRTRVGRSRSGQEGKYEGQDQGKRVRNRYKGVRNRLEGKTRIRRSRPEIYSGPV